MKKLLKLTIKVLPVIIMIVLVAMPAVFGAIIDPEVNTGGLQPKSVQTQTLVGNVWSILKLILQIAAIGALVFAGVRYMFSSADQKADIKKSMGILAVGAVLVFGASIVVEMLVNIMRDLSQT